MNETGKIARRQLGKIGPLVSVQGWAAWECPSFTGPATMRESMATIHRSLELGINFLDTADVYGWAKTKSWSGKR